MKTAFNQTEEVEKLIETRWLTVWKGANGISLSILLDENNRAFYRHSYDGGMDAANHGGIMPTMRDRIGGIEREKEIYAIAKMAEEVLCSRSYKALHTN